MPRITRPQVYRVVREMLPREQFGVGELLRWLEGVQQRNERDRCSHKQRRAALRASPHIPPCTVVIILTQQKLNLLTSRRVRIRLPVRCTLPTATPFGGCAWLFIFPVRIVCGSGVTRRFGPVGAERFRRFDPRGRERSLPDCDIGVPDVFRAGSLCNLVLLAAAESAYRESPNSSHIRQPDRGGVCGSGHIFGRFRDDAP